MKKVAAVITVSLRDFARSSSAHATRRRPLFYCSFPIELVQPLTTFSSYGLLSPLTNK